MLPVSHPTLGFQGGMQLLRATLRDVQLDQTDRPARVVVDPDVLDVDATGADVGEEPGQLARMVRH